MVSVGVDLQSDPPAPGSKDHSGVFGEGDRVGGHSVDGCSPWKIGSITSRIINRNHQSLGYVPVALGLANPSPRRKYEVSGQRFLPEMLFLHFLRSTQEFNS